MTKKGKKKDKPQRWIVVYTYKVEVEANSEDEAYERAGDQLSVEGRIKPQDLDCERAYVEGSDKLYAIVDDGSMDGDSAYYCPGSHVPYREGMTLAEIRETWHEANVKDLYGTDDKSSIDPEDLAYTREDADAIAVAWVVTEKQLEQLGNGWPDVGNDSATYAANRTMKTMAAAMALKTITEEKS